MLWPHAVIHRDHHATGLLAQRAAQHIVRVQIANGPAAAMQVNQGGHGLGGRNRVVHPHSNVHARMVEMQVLHPPHLGRIGLRERAPRPVRNAGFDRRLRVNRRNALFAQESHQGLGLRVEHGATPGENVGTTD